MARLRATSLANGARVPAGENCRSPSGPGSAKNDGKSVVDSLEEPSAFSLLTRIVYSNANCSALERRIRPRDGPPHVGDGRVVVPEPFLRLLEVAPNDVDKRLDRYDGVRIERIQVVYGDEPRFHVPLVVPDH